MPHDLIVGKPSFARWNKYSMDFFKRLKLENFVVIAMGVQTLGGQQMIVLVYNFFKKSDEITRGHKFCRNPNLGLVTKAKVCKGAGQE